ncbi:hypothetical protein NMY22_g11110 [Coprinellus aureogranulatus]|nr:hypothetical protein NMY22_g11110 [Coprinellus aureogranulatus]
MTITLDDRTPIPLHPLDLTSPPETSHSPVSSSDAMCVGLLQAADAYLGRPNSIGDMILGVPFLRNVYSVMAYAAPKDDGTFERPWPEGATGEEEVEDPDTNSTTPNPTRPGNVMPRLGLMSMTDPTIALEEFKTVRVLNQPISNGTHSGGSANTSRDGANGRHGLSVGIIVLIALVGFFAVCFALFALRWFLIRRKYGKGGSGSVPASGRNTPLPWSGFGLGGGGGGADGSNSVLSADASDEAKLAKMLGAGIGGVGEKATYPPRPSESRTVVAKDDDGKRLSEDSVYSNGDATGDNTVSTLVAASKSSDALMKVHNKPSVSTFRSSEDRDVAAMAWPADTATLASKSSRARLQEQERARNDSSVLPRGRWGDEEVPPLPSNAPLIASRDASPLRRSGDNVRDSGIGGEDTLSTSVDSYYATASPLAPLPLHSQLPLHMRQDRQRHSRGSQHHRPAPSFPPSKTKRNVDSGMSFASPLPSSTLGDFSDVGSAGGYGHRSSKSVPSAAATWGENTDSMGSFYYTSPTSVGVGGVLKGVDEFGVGVPVRVSGEGGEVRGVLSVSNSGKARRVVSGDVGGEGVGVAL